jgi:hypothetical protein
MIKNYEPIKLFLAILIVLFFLPSCRNQIYSFRKKVSVKQTNHKKSDIISTELFSKLEPSFRPLEFKKEQKRQKDNTLKGSKSLTKENCSFGSKSSFHHLKKNKTRKVIPIEKNIKNKSNHKENSIIKSKNYNEFDKDLFGRIIGGIGIALIWLSLAALVLGGINAVVIGFVFAIPLGVLLLTISYIFRKKYKLAIIFSIFLAAYLFIILFGLIFMPI